MAQAVWEGFLRLSLVSCPVRLHRATDEAEPPRLEQLNAKTGNPVARQYVDSKTGDVVPEDGLVQGHHVEGAGYVAVSEEELKQLAGDPSDVIDLDRFVPAERVDRTLLDAGYYILPEGQLARDTLDALRLAMQRSSRVGVGHAHLDGRDRFILVEPHGAGLMMSSLRNARELATPQFDERSEAEIPTEMIDIAEAIIARRSGEFDAAALRDPYDDRLRALLQRKARAARNAPTPPPGAAPVPEPPPAPPPPAPLPTAPLPTVPLPTAAVEALPEPAIAAAPAPQPPKPVAVTEAQPEPRTAPAPIPAEAAPPPPPPAPEPPPPPPEPEPPRAAAPPPPPPPTPPIPPPPIVAAPAAASAAAPPPAEAAGPAIQDVGAEILLHIMGLGDRRYVEPGWAGHPGSRRQIEAISIRPRDRLAPSAVEFRVFAQEGRATAWVSNGNYAGTRGRGLPLTGFAVRPAPELRDRLEITYEGCFFEGGVVGPKTNGELCMSPVADDPLEAVRVTVVERPEG